MEGESMINVDFNGKSVLVVGGTGGINRGIAMSFAEHGASVAVASRSQDKVDDTLQALREAGAKAWGFAADVRDYPSLESGIERAAEEIGKFDVLVSGAAGNFPALANEMSPNGFKSVVDIDLIGTYHVMKASHPFLNRPGASVINISAPQAFSAMVAQSHVCAAKAGVDMITRTLSLEWGVEGVRVNGIMPGPIEGTEGMRRLAPSPAAVDAIKQSVPLGRLGEIQDVANASLFLASPLADFISGVILPVDGGWILGGFTSLGKALNQLGEI